MSETGGPGYRIYVDESGDPGLRVIEGSTAWFVLAGLLTRLPDERTILPLADSLRALLKKEQGFIFHFHKLKHEQRVAVVRRLSQERNVRAIVVAIHKPSILEPEGFATGDGLYHHALRLLLERASWLCAGTPPRKGRDATLDVLLSHRGGLVRDEVQKYFEELERLGGTGGNKIDFRIIRPANVRVVHTRNKIGLQLADIFATGTRYGIEPNGYGDVEPRYLKEVLPLLYRKNEQVLGYGLKFFPRECSADAGLKEIL